MPVIKLIADSGSTKAEWCIIGKGRGKTIFTDGISPYFLSSDQIIDLLQTQLMPGIGKTNVDEVWFYGTGCKNPVNRKSVEKAIKHHFPNAKVSVDHDLMGAARAVCGERKGVACILGTGSNSCFYNGRKIVKNSPGLGYVLGDEGSGAYLGRKVLQYYLYNTFDEDLRSRFDAKYVTTASEILDNVYKKPLPNKYLASFALFLAENRGHYMVENIIEDGLNDFFFNHIYKYRESWKYPLYFVGGIAYGFRDVLLEMAAGYELEVGKILKNPMEGLVEYHR
jgi:N-acetylglucosamine kinase-like BadF-type ATPase